MLRISEYTHTPTSEIQTSISSINRQNTTQIMREQNVRVQLIRINQIGRNPNNFQSTALTSTVASSKDS